MAHDEGEDRDEQEVVGVKKEKELPVAKKRRKRHWWEL